MAHIEIYTSKVCPYCDRAKALLKAKKASYQEYDISQNPVWAQESQTRSGRRTVPQIFVDGVSIGGCDDLYALESMGKLDELLQL